MNEYRQRISDFDGIAYPITEVLFSPDDTLLAGVFCTRHDVYGACAGEAIRAWETTDYTEAFTIYDTYSIFLDSSEAFQFIPNSQRLAYLDNDDLRIYDYSSYSTSEFDLEEYLHNSAGMPIVFSGDGTIGASGTGGGVQIFSAIDGRQIDFIPVEHPLGYGYGVSAIALNQDGSLAAAYNGVRGVQLLTIQVFDVSTQREIANQSFNGNRISDLFFTPEDELVIITNNHINTWDLADSVLSYQSDGIPNSSHMNQDNLTVIELTGIGLRIVEYPSQTVQAELTGFYPELKSMAIHPDSQLIAAGYKDNRVRIWNSNGGTLQSTIESDTLFFGIDIDFNPTGNLLAISAQQSVTIWDVEQEQITTVLSDYLGNVNDVGFIVDGRYLVTGSVVPSDDPDYYTKTVVRLLTVDTWEEVAVYEQFGATSLSEPVSTSLAIEANGNITSLNTATLEQNMAFYADTASSIVLHPNLNTTVIGQWAGNIAVYTDGEYEIQIPLPLLDVTEMAFDSPGSLLVANGVIIDTEAWSILRIIGDDNMRISALAFSLDNRFLALGSIDGTIRLWEIQSFLTR